MEELQTTTGKHSAKQLTETTDIEDEDGNEVNNNNIKTMAGKVERSDSGMHLKAKKCTTCQPGQPAL